MYISFPSNITQFLLYNYSKHVAPPLPSSAVSPTCPEPSLFRNWACCEAVLVSQFSLNTALVSVICCPQGSRANFGVARLPLRVAEWHQCYDFMSYLYSTLAGSHDLVVGDDDSKYRWVWLFPASPRVLKPPMITQLYFRTFALTGTFRSSSFLPTVSPDAQCS